MCSVTVYTYEYTHNHLHVGGLKGLHRREGTEGEGRNENWKREEESKYRREEGRKIVEGLREALGKG